VSSSPLCLEVLRKAPTNLEKVFASGVNTAETVVVAIGYKPVTLSAGTEFDEPHVGDYAKIKLARRSPAVEQIAVERQKLNASVPGIAHCKARNAGGVLLQPTKADSFRIPEPTLLAASGAKPPTALPVRAQRNNGMIQLVRAIEVPLTIESNGSQRTL
jgi:hypothetical protein